MKHQILAIFGVGLVISTAIVVTAIKLPLYLLLGLITEGDKK